MAVNKRLLQGAAAAGELVPSEHFGVVLYEGDGSSSHSINGGKFGAGGYFNGEQNSGASYVEISSSTTSPVSSVSFWMRTSIKDSNEGNMFAAGGASSSNTGFTIARDATTGYIKVFFANGQTGNIQSFVGNTDIADDNWHHIVLSMASDNTFVIYLDGTSHITGTRTRFTTSNSHNLSVNRLGTNAAAIGAGAYEGKLDQVRIFQKALSSSEVSTLYAETTPESLDPLNVDTTDTLQVLGDTSCVATYRFENDETDLSGNFNGTGTEIQYAAGRYGQAASFSGADNCIINFGAGGIQATSAVSNSFSISWWMKTTTTTQQKALFNTYGDATGAFGFALEMKGTDGGQIKMFTNYGGTDVNSGFTSNTYNDGNWHNFVLVKDVSGSSMKLYADKEEVLNITISTSAHVGNPLVFGNYTDHSSATYKYTGLLDQARTFNKAISTSEITTLYNENPLVASYRFEGNANDDMRAYNGTASNVTYEYGLGFTPDLVWIKSRSFGRNHYWYDTTRGANKQILSNATDAEANITGRLSAFDTGGFTVGSSSEVNNSGETYAAWAFKANGGTTSSNSDGTITSTVQANQDSGFSIVKYTGNGTDNATVGHGLSQTPELYILKNLDDAHKWPVHTQDVGSLSGNQTGALNLTEAFGSYGKNATSTVLTFSTGADRNPNGDDMIAYCFHSVDSFSKIGSYSGNGSTNLIEIDFEPAFIMIKKTSGTGDWRVYDNKRGSSSARYPLYANLTNTEGEGVNEITFLSNGFQVGPGNNTNDSGSSYIYMAFAADPDTEAPTVAKSFSTVAYTGNGSANRQIDLGFKPGLYWLKTRDSSGCTYHNWFDIIRGGNKTIYSNVTSAEVTDQGCGYISSFDDNGVTYTGDASGINNNGEDFVAWAWKADDNEPTINTEGSIDSLVSANANAGFSIVKYEGNGTSGATVAHGLSAAPDMVIAKGLSGSASSWWVRHKSVASTDVLELNSSNAKANYSSVFNNTNPSSTVVTLGSGDTNRNGETQILYCFHDVAGYQKLGSYSGSSSAVTVTTGFKPDFIMIKRTNNSSRWIVLDSVRNNFTSYLDPSDSLAEQTDSEIQLSVTSTTFVLPSGANSAINTSGNDYIYAAFKIN